MGRVKLKIKKLESTGSRQVTYSKRRNGIMKKARELAILCDIDIVLLMFSPSGKPALYEGERRYYITQAIAYHLYSPLDDVKVIGLKPDIVGGSSFSYFIEAFDAPKSC